MSQFGCMCAILANLHVLRVKKSIVERYVSNVFVSERKVRVFYSQSDKILGVIYPK